MGSTSKDKGHQFSPEAYLVYKKAYGSATEDALKLSSLGQNGNIYTKVAKLKGNYKPEIVVSKLVNTDGTTIDNRLLNLENHKITAMVPEIRLYRVLEGEEQGVIPFYFPVSADYGFDGSDVLNLQKSSFSAGAAAIKSFSFSLTGQNPYQVTRKFLNANLSIKVDNLSVLFDQVPGYALLADLFTIRAGAAKSTRFQGSAKGHSAGALGEGQSCRIVATLGYSVPRDYSIFTSDEIITIEQTKQIINLYYSGHDLQVAQDGATDVSIKYTGYLETVNDDSNFDFLSDSKTKAANNRRQSKTDRASKKINDVMTKKDKALKKGQESDEEKKERRKKTNQNIRDAFASLTDNLKANNKIYKTTFDKKSFYATTNTDTAQQPQTPAPKAPVSPGSVFSTLAGPMIIDYFTFGDFIESYFKKIGTDLEEAIRINSNKKKTSKGNKQDLEASIKEAEAAIKSLKMINVLMCEVNVQKKKISTEAQTFYENIADIPIAVDTLMHLLYSEITKQTIAFFDMTSFLKFSLKLLSRSFDYFPGAPIIEDIEFKMSTYTASSLKRKINRGQIDIEDTEKSTGSFTKGSIKDLAEYIVFHQAPAKYSRSPGSGQRKKDSQAGIFHLQPNKDRGFLKNVTFSKISQPAREASLVVGNGDLYDELRIPHNATAQMYGNFMFLPGSQVYVDPNTIGFGSVRETNSAARRLGFGGYYTVEQVSTVFDSGRLDTTLSLLFNAFPETESEPSLSTSQKNSIRQVTIGGTNYTKR